MKKYEYHTVIHGIPNVPDDPPSGGVLFFLENIPIYHHAFMRERERGNDVSLMRREVGRWRRLESVDDPPPDGAYEYCVESVCLNPLRGACLKPNSHAPDLSRPRSPDWTMAMDDFEAAKRRYLAMVNNPDERLVGLFYRPIVVPWSSWKRSGLPPDGYIPPWKVAADGLTKVFVSGSPFDADGAWRMDYVPLGPWTIHPVLFGE